MVTIVSVILEMLALLDSSLLERKTNEIDKEWIEGIRKGWKLWVKEASKFPGRTLNAKSMDYSIVAQAAGQARAFLNHGRVWIKRLREDLLFNKGFWARPGQGPTKEKVIQLLAQAESAISDGVSKIDFTEHSMNPDHGYDRENAYASQEKFDFHLRGIAAAVEAEVKNADGLISGKLLRHLSSMVTEFGSVDFPEYEPPVVNVDGATIIFSDTPIDPSKPSAYGDDAEKARHPQERAQYIAQCKEAKALLARRNLGFLWYGNFEVKAGSTRPANPNGAQFKTGAEYYRQGDKVVIYSDPSPGLSRLLIHELGHRYYFKYLSRGEQERFREWFGQVMASTEYGKSNSEEDFAEVFADYVMGTDLTRDQIDRLKAFLSKGKNDLRESDNLKALLAELQAYFTSST